MASRSLEPSGLFLVPAFVLNGYFWLVFVRCGHWLCLDACPVGIPQCPLEGLHMWTLSALCVSKNSLSAYCELGHQQGAECESENQDTGSLLQGPPGTHDGPILLTHYFPIVV